MIWILNFKRYSILAQLRITSEVCKIAGASYELDMGWSWLVIARSGMMSMRGKSRETVSVSQQGGKGMPRQ